MTKDTPLLISVVIPTYNRANYIAKTIQSVLQQTYISFELIVVDDGSTDNTEAVVASFTDARVSYYKKANGERAAARNYGVNRANGAYVTFLDSDDLFMPDHLAEAIRYILKNPAIDIFHQGYNVVDPEGRVLYPWKPLPDPVNRKLEEGNFLSCLGIFVKRDILTHQPFNEDRALSGTEDYELWMRLAARYSIRTNAVVTASLVNHESRSVLQIDAHNFITRITLAKKYISDDEQAKLVYGPRLKKISAYLDLYAALHLAISNRRAIGFKFLYMSFAQWPAVMFNYRFLVVIKKLILS
jgi:glycosyltransferase involved in cell wall biosynthesis